ncbi:MAG: adenine phosphoribosyltransferase [Treponemataceae bacterium]|nr:MAG: adenine phosphoribosyltransferase [Treponemataceae bacterium]
MNDTEFLDSVIRRVPDHPKKGILFYDITGILVDPKAFSLCVDRMVEHCQGVGATAVSGVEARGFLFAAPIAKIMGIPLVLVRKKGHLPGKTFSCKYSLEYGEAEVEVHASDITAGQKVIVIDDLIATGGTLAAGRTVLEQGGAKVIGYLGVLGLPMLGYAEKLAPLPVKTLITYDHE